MMDYIAIATERDAGNDKLKKQSKKKSKEKQKTII